MPASDLLDGRVAVVTGSTRGIGLAIAQAFAEAGARVMVNGSSSEEAARDVASTLPGEPGAHAGCQADVRSSADVTAMAARVREHFGRCDILVNNAGFTKFIPHENLDELSDGIFDRVVLTNLKGPFIGARAFAPMLREHGDGLIVNISSIAATSAIGSNVAYCASKAGLVNLTKSLARALAPGIRVNAVSPGLADTEFTKGFGEYRQRQVDLTPMGRLASTVDIAACVLALATTLTFVTGEEISVDGGRLLT